VDRSVRAAGTIAPAAVWDVRATESSPAVRIIVQVGDTVVAGQSVALLDPRERMIELTDARSRLRLLLADIARARADLEYRSTLLGVSLRQSRIRVDAADAELRGRLADLLITDPVEVVLRRHVPGSAVLLDEAVAAYQQALVTHELEAARSAELRLDSLALSRLLMEAARAREQIAHAEERVERRTVRAPAAGVVVWDSSFAAGETMRGQGELLFRIAQPEWIALLAVGERDAERITAGQEVRLVLAAGDRPLQGLVTRIAPVPAAAAGVQGAVANPRYRVWARIPGGEAEPLRTGYTVEARIVIGREPALHSLIGRLFGRGRGT
jgi:multidrug resistance efflux pump